LLEGLVRGLPLVPDLTDAEPSRAAPDIFEKACTHERKELLELAKKSDLLPYSG
jgi:hypothetical protein